MNNKTHFREYNPDQQFLFPPDIKEWLPEDDLAYFVMDVVSGLDLGAIHDDYDGSSGGQPAYDPRMMVKLGHIALDGTKVRANASKHKAMSYGRMEKKVVELEAEVVQLLKRAESVDAQEDALYGKGRRGDEFPDELRYKESRLRKIKEAMNALKREAEAQARMDEKRNRKRRGRKRPERSVKPDSKAQRNFTDPDSRIIMNGATKSFEQSYNCQAAVDDKAQMIVATHVTQQANDKQQVKPMVGKLKENTGGRKPRRLSADSGYFSEENVIKLEDEGIDAYIATKKRKHGQKPLVAERGGL